MPQLKFFLNLFDGLQIHKVFLLIYEMAFLSI